MQLSEIFIHNSLLAITFVGIIISCIPLINNWKFPYPTSDYVSIDLVPIVIGIKSIEYKISLISSMSLSVHMVLDYCGHAIVSPDDFFSYRDSTSNLILLISLLVPDLIQYFYIIPHQDFILFHCVQYIRFILTTCTTLAYLSKFGGKIWRTHEVVYSAGIIAFASVMRFFSCFFIGNSLIIFEVATILAFAIGSFAIFLLLKRWFLQIYRNNFHHNTLLLSFDQYCCNIYIAAAAFTIAGLWILLLVYKVPVWYQYDTTCLVSETMLFSIFYVIVTVFQGRAAVREAAISKVRAFISANTQTYVTNVLLWQQSLDIKKMFVRYISHEIRTPLNTVGMGLQVLKEELTVCGAHADVLRTVTNIENCCEIAVDILNDLLVFDKLDSGILKLELERLNVFDFLTETIHPFFLQVM